MATDKEIAKGAVSMAYYNPPQYGGYMNSMGNNYPMSYPQMQTQQSQSGGGLTWVQGEAAAKSWFVAAGNSVPLFDTEAPVFYIKATDATGMPMPLRTFKYSEVMQGSATTQAALNSDEYNELKKRCDRLEAMLTNALSGESKISKEENADAQSVI